jgi:hypothetical protein
MSDDKSARKQAVRAKITEDEIDLDDLVIELKSNEASELNNAGTDAQLDYLIEAGGLPWVEDVVFSGLAVRYE